MWSGKDYARNSRRAAGDINRKDTLNVECFFESGREGKRVAVMILGRVGVHLESTPGQYIDMSYSPI